MSEAFLRIVNMSISASWLVLVVLALRFLLKKAPKWVNVLLWGLVAIRLICPISIESSLSLIPDWQIGMHDLAGDYQPAANGQILDSGGNVVLEKELNTGTGEKGQILDSDGNVLIEKPLNPLQEPADTLPQTRIHILSSIWLAGILIMSGYTLISYFCLKRKVSTSIPVQKGVRQSEYIDSPFVLGMFCPVVYLPYGMDNKSLTHVIAHEKAHIRRKDHWWKPLGFLLLAIHWFNPLMWVAYILLCRDIELACDEKVIRALGNEQRADYSQALVACSVSRLRIAACPLAFGEVGVKERVKNVMNYKKPGFWIIIVSLVFCAMIAVCFLTNPLDSVDYLKLTWCNNPVSPDQIDYEINLGNRVMSGEVYAEQWISGTCVRSAPVMLTRSVDSICITIRDRRDESEQAGVEILIETDEYGGSLTTFFPYPENYDGAYYEAGNELNKRIKVMPDQEVILKARSFQCGDGIRPFTCETLLTNQELMESQDCILVIRAVFSEDPINHAVSSPVSILRGRLMDIQDGCFLVEPIDGSQELRIADRIEVPTKHMEPSPEPQIGDILQIEYDGTIQEVYPARITNVYRISVAEQGSIVMMVPTDTSLEGLCAGALLLPMDGHTYRYLLKDSTPEGVTAEQLLFSFQEIDMGESILNEVYSLKEYPDRSKVLLISAKNGPWLCEYSPPQRCSDSALNDAIEAGYVVMENGIAAHGQELWREFYKQTQQGNAASVTVAHYTTLNTHASSNFGYTQAFQQDYPHLDVYLLCYDGKQFTLSFGEENDAETRTYEYLMKYENGPRSAFDSIMTQYRYTYVLTHDNHFTYDQLWMSAASSQLGAYIDHCTIYSEPKE